jgi:hypothetical protein
LLKVRLIGKLISRAMTPAIPPIENASPVGEISQAPWRPPEAFHNNTKPVVTVSN